MELEKPIVIAIVAVILSVAAIASSVVLKPAPFTLEDGAVTTAKIANNAVDNTKLADNAVTENDIADGAVTGSKIASGAVDNTKLAGNAVTSAKILDNSIQNIDINDAAGIAGSKLANYSITNLQLGNNCVTENKIADNAVTYSDMAIKIKAGMTAVANGGAIAHGLGVTPTSVSLTLENKAATTDNFVIYVRGLNAENITVGITKNGAAHEASENIYWIAIYTP